jgi:carbamoyl-phosphate synthase small subunit
VGLAAGEAVTQALIDEPLRKAKARPAWPAWTGQGGHHPQPYEWTQTEWKLGKGYGKS